MLWVAQEIVANGNLLDIVGAAVVGAVIMFLLMHSRAAGAPAKEAPASSDSGKSKQSAKSKRPAGEFGNFDVPTTMSLIQTRRSIFPKVRALRCERISVDHAVSHRSAALKPPDVVAGLELSWDTSLSSCRGRFTTLFCSCRFQDFDEVTDATRISQESVQLLVEAANWAPCHGKTEPWRFVIVSRETMAGKFAELEDAVWTELLADSPKQLEKRLAKVRRAKYGSVHLCHPILHAHAHLFCDPAFCDQLQKKRKERARCSYTVFICMARVPSKKGAMRDSIGRLLVRRGDSQALFDDAADIDQRKYTNECFVL